MKIDWKEKKRESRWIAARVSEERSAVAAERSTSLEASPQELLKYAISSPWDVLANPSLPLLALENPTMLFQIITTAQSVLAFARRNVRLQAWRDQGGLPIFGSQCRWWKVATGEEIWWMELKLLCSLCVPKGNPKRKEGGRTMQAFKQPDEGHLLIGDPEIASTLSKFEDDMVRCSHLAPLHGEDPPAVVALTQKLFEERQGHPCGLLSKGFSRYS